MCNLKDTINKEHLEEVLKLINNMKNDNGVKLLQNSLSPRDDSRFVIFTGWKFEVAGTIYDHCNPTEVMKFTDRINNSLLEKIISSFIVISGTKHIFVGIDSNIPIRNTRILCRIFQFPCIIKIHGKIFD